MRKIKARLMKFVRSFFEPDFSFAQLCILGITADMIRNGHLWKGIGLMFIGAVICAFIWDHLNRKKAGNQ